MPIVRGRNNGEIQKTKLLLVEGKDEVIFFNALLKGTPSIDEIQIVEVGGVSNFKTELPALINTTGFSDNVTSIAIVRDADDSFDASFQSICSLLTKHGLPKPSKPNSFTTNNNIMKIGVFIMPGNPEDGTMLEDLCLKTQTENPIMDCVNNYFSCLEGKSIELPKNIAKAKTQVFLAAMPKIVSSVGLAAQKKYWDFSHPSLWTLNEFLNEL